MPPSPFRQETLKINEKFIFSFFYFLFGFGVFYFLFGFGAFDIYSSSSKTGSLTLSSMRSSAGR